MIGTLLILLLVAQQPYACYYYDYYLCMSKKLRFGELNNISKVTGLVKWLDLYLKTVEL